MGGSRNCVSQTEAFRRHNMPFINAFTPSIGLDHDKTNYYSWSFILYDHQLCGTLWLRQQDSNTSAELQLTSLCYEWTCIKEVLLSVCLAPGLNKWVVTLVMERMPQWRTVLFIELFTSPCSIAMPNLKKDLHCKSIACRSGVGNR